MLALKQRLLGITRGFHHKVKRRLASWLRRSA
jgi:hypothetical protein